MYLLYDLAFLLAGLLLIPRYLNRGLRRGTWRQGLGERFGRVSPTKLATIGTRKVIWVHAVSVGEVRAAIPLIRALRRSRPDAAILLTTVTESGRDAAAGLGDVDLHCFFPFDLSPIVYRILKTFRPALIVMIETEIWPNFIRTARRFGMPVVLVNGRISDRSFSRYRRLKFLLRPVLSAYAAFCMQSDRDADRIRRLGAPAERIVTTGNLKFDLPLDTFCSERDDLRFRYGLPPDGTVWAAGSTHPGEEEAIIQAFRALGEAGHEINLVLIPRHPHRAAAIAAMFDKKGIPWVLKSRFAGTKPCVPPGTVLLIDSFGETLPLYAAADIVFVGGSLVKVGGHNLLEAAMVRRPVLFGPHMENFRDISERIVAVGAGRCVAGAKDLFREVLRLSGDPEECRRMGDRGIALIRENSGVSTSILKTLHPLLES